MGLVVIHGFDYRQGWINDVRAAGYPPAVTFPKPIGFTNLVSHNSRYEFETGYSKTSITFINWSAFFRVQKSS
jgi:hypothetical protein